jgi:hypothetical protein
LLLLLSAAEQAELNLKREIGTHNFDVTKAKQKLLE